MTLVAGTTRFPNNVIALCAARVKTFIDPDLFVIQRPLRTTDRTQSVGIFPATKRTDERTAEMTGSPSGGEPTIKRYNFIIQTLVQGTKEPDTISIHSILSSDIWDMYYRDPALAAGLTSLAIVKHNSVERFQKRGVELQRYLSNEIQGGSFAYTSWTECWFETETTEMA